LSTRIVVRCSNGWLSGRCFFYSSRRPHTRSPRDWSSDGCSSDLAFSAMIFRVVRAAVGEAHVARKIIALKAAIGGEGNGGVMYTDRKSVVEGRRVVIGLFVSADWQKNSKVADRAGADYGTMEEGA